jgi:gliding motility-associated lipoprotein GldH
MMQRIGLGITALLLLMTACQAPSGPRSRSFDEECWAYPDSLSWEQELAGERLEMMVLLKFTDAYNYRNLYLRLHLQGPNGLDTVLRRTETFIDPLGNWEVEPQGSQIPYAFTSFEKIPIPKAGTYRFSLSQDMREDTLCGIASVRVDGM